MLVFVLPFGYNYVISAHFLVLFYVKKNKNRYHKNFINTSKKWDTKNLFQVLVCNKSLTCKFLLYHQPSLGKYLVTFSISDVLYNFLVYVDSLEFEAEPDYDRCRKMFRDALQKSKHPLVTSTFYSIWNEICTKAFTKEPSSLKILINTDPFGCIIFFKAFNLLTID